MSEENESYISPTYVEPTAEAEASEPTVEIEGAEPSEQIEPASDPAEETAKKESGVQKRIDQLTREKHELRSRLEALEAANKQKDPDQPSSAPPAVPGKPIAEDFDSYEEFVEALTDWKADQRDARKAAEQERRTVEEKNAARIEAARASKEDFDAVVSNLNGIMVPPVVIDAIRESESSADLFYYLGQNVEEAKKLQGLSITAQLREIGKIEAKLEKKDSPPVKRVSSAPVPLNPVGGTTTAAKDVESMTDDEWLRHEQARLKKQGRLY